MNYQEKKIHVIARTFFITLAMSVVLALSLIYPERAESIVRHLPVSRRGNEYTVFVGAMITLVTLCWGVILGLIFTSPEQEVRFVRWTRRYRSNPIPFEAIEFDTLDPDCRKAAWRYFLDRCRR